MNEVARRGMDPADFYRWLQSQDARYELVDGVPVAMAGANRRHDRIVVNALRLIDGHLAGHRCQTFSADTFIRIPAGNRRQADLGIDCGTPDENSLEADEPSLLVEILSPTTRAFDRQDKIEEYKTIASLSYILLVDPDAPQVRLYSRADDRTWHSERIAGLEAAVSFPLFGMTLRLADLYERLQFRPRPVLVEETARFGI